MDRGRRNEPAEMLAVVLLGFLLRLFAGRNTLTEMGVLIPGYDEYYHMRRILYTVNHFSGTIWFDSYLNYPYGLNITWPPLFDQISALPSLALGQHSQPGVEMVSIFVPPILGALSVAVVYFMIREIFDRRMALLAAFMTAISSNHISRTSLGEVDHHCLEILLLLGSLLFITLALTRPERRYLFAACAGVIMAGLAYTWAGADIYLGIFLIYAAVQMTLDLKRGASSKETATSLLAAFGVALFLVLPFWNARWLRTSFLGLAALIVATMLLLAASEFMAKRRVHWAALPLTALLLSAAFFLIAPHLGSLLDVTSLIQSGGEYLFTGEYIGKITEAEPLFYNWETFSSLIFSRMGLNILLSLAGLAALAALIRGEEGRKRQGQVLLLVWAISAFILTLGQIRFLYIYTIAMGIAICILFFHILGSVERRMADQKKETPKALAVVLLLLLVLPTAAETAVYINGSHPPIAGDWYESLTWLEKNSNSTSYYDAPAKVPEYSVMSWWDIGNWIVYVSQRPVVANNFQAGIKDAVKFYLSESEEAATAVLDKRGSRYIVTYYDMMYGKLPAITSWANENLTSYIKMEEQGSNVDITPLPRLLNTTLARLYLFDGAGTSHFRLIHESQTFLSQNPPKSQVKIFEYVPGALIRIKTEQDQRVGVLLNMTSNQGRAFVYINEALPKDGEYEVRVPYSTEPSHETHALGPYLIFSGNDKGVRMQNINVSEQDVIDGKTIEASF